jgi:N-acetylglucosaminyldiphosphoundecaprenol N-acetyl-beta-D-mannosaminyltransferase
VKQARVREIADLEIHDITFDETVSEILARVSEGTGGYVCTPNVDYVVRARRDPAFRSAIMGAFLRVPDGMWIIYASRLARRPLRGTVTGRLLVPALAERARDRSLPIALYGAPPGVAEEASKALQRKFPDLAVVSASAPPMGFKIGSPEDMAEADVLRSLSPAILFVALGAPRQEQWMQRHAPDFDGTVLVGIGAAFDIIAGRFREAPRWMTQLGLEWAFRLAQEPRRLARRYLVEDPWILLWALRTRFQ